MSTSRSSFSEWLLGLDLPPLQEAGLLHLGVEMRRGPYVSPHAFSLAADRFWLVMPRGALKTRVVRSNERFGALLRFGDDSIVLVGEATVLDAFRPLDLL